MRVIVAGGREVRDYEIVPRAIEASGFEVTELVSGGASGVDTLGEHWANTHGIPVARFTANWQKHGRAAGPIRNRQMAAYAQALIAIPTGGRGTANMIHEATAFGLKIFLFPVADKEHAPWSPCLTYENCIQGDTARCVGGRP